MCVYFCRHLCVCLTFTEGNKIFVYLYQGAALGMMVGWMTYGYKKFESIDTIMRQAIPPLNDATQRLLPLIDMDSEAYRSYTEATKLPQKTEEEKTK